MKKLFYQITTALVLGAALAVTFNSQIAFAVGSVFGIVMPYLSHFVLPNAALFTVPWMDSGDFKKMSSKDASELDDEQLFEYKDALEADYERQIKELKEDEKSNPEEMHARKKELSTVKNETLKQALISNKL